MKMKRADLLVGLKGFAMGIAEVIPGVSGGTIALITGIYERLLNAIKSIDLQLLRLLATLKVKSAFQHLDGLFFTTLLIGMAAGVVVGIFGVTHVLETSPEVLWGFFFGLILASVWLIGREVNFRKALHLVLFIAGTAVAFLITWMYPITGSTNLLYVFLCGMIAICALILPGISGSFLLLLLGMYTVVIPTVKALLLEQRLEDLLLVLTFAAGCLVGLLSFARVMSYLFRKFKAPTLAALTGFMLGSLPKIWPWRNPVLYLDGEGVVREGIPGVGEDFHILREQLVLPANYHASNHTLIVILACLAGIAAVVILAKTAGENEPYGQ